MTNFEWLKSLSEQEIAELLSSIENITELNRVINTEITKALTMHNIDACEEYCRKYWLKWLQEERQESNDKL